MSKSKSIPLPQGTGRYVSIGIPLWEGTANCGKTCTSQQHAYVPLLWVLPVPFYYVLQNRWIIIIFFTLWLCLLIAYIQQIIKMVLKFYLRINIFMLLIPISFTYFVINAGGL